MHIGKHLERLWDKSKEFGSKLRRQFVFPKTREHIIAAIENDGSQEKEKKIKVRRMALLDSFTEMVDQQDSLDLNTLAEGDTVYFTTSNTEYVAVRTSGEKDEFFITGGKYFPRGGVGVITGATENSQSAILIQHRIVKGFGVEMYSNEQRKVTTPVQEIWIKRKS